VPSGAVFVSPNGSDSASGSQSAPYRTLAKAATAAPSNGVVVVMRGGTYNEQVAVYKPLTIQNYPGEAAWLDGSVGVSGWVKDGTRWRHDGWTTRFDHSPTYTKGAADSTTPNWQFVNKSTAPMAAHPDQVWINGAFQSQASSLDKVGAGSFFLDESSSRLYVGSDPTSKSVTASNQTQALNLRSSGITVRGIGIRRYAPSVWHVGAITLEKPGITFENVRISEMATTGISVQSSGATLRKVTVDNSGMLGIHGRFADGLTLDRVSSTQNNRENFNIAPVSGGVKLGATRGITVVDSNFSDNYGHGFWEDMSVYNSVFRGTNFSRNTGDGLFLEISAKVIVGDSLFSGNKLDGIKVNNTSNVKIWNNTFVGNGRPLDLVQDFRRNTNRSDQAVDPRVSWPDPEMPWELDSVTVSNNVVALSTSAANCLLCVEDYSSRESAEAMRIKANGNLYNRSSGSSPTWLAVWSRGAGNPYVFTTLAALKSTTGQEARGQEVTGQSIVTASGALSDASNRSAAVAVALPSDVATAIGRPAGAVQLGIWSASGGTAPDPVPTTDPPATPPPATSGTLAKDGFSRTVNGGWGSADTGGSWSIPAGAGQFSTGNGTGRMKLNRGDGFSASLGQVSSSSTDVSVNVATDVLPGSNGYFVNLVGRSVSGQGDYRTKTRISADGSVAVWLLRSSGANETVFASTVLQGVKVGAGEKLRIRLQVGGTGTTQLRTKAWKTGGTEPSSWLLSGTDNYSGLQKAGSIGLYAYSNGSATGGAATLAFSDLTATPVA
jgi:hypothetical protein